MRPQAWQQATRQCLSKMQIDAGVEQTRRNDNGDFLWISDIRLLQT